jgi:CrcB protein
MLKVLLVAGGGALGATARYLTATGIHFLFGSRFPYGTMLVNCLGALLLGLFVSLVLERTLNTDHLRLFVIVGFLGGYTTFSSFAWETVALYSNGQWVSALLNVILTNVITIAGIVFGLQLGRMI